MEADGGLVVCSSCSDGELLISAAGELDFAAAPELVEAIDAALRHGVEACVLDISLVTFVDTEGIRALISAKRRFAASGVALTITPGSPHVYRIVRLLGLDGELGWDVDAPQSATT